jgi:hypothetical protein
VLCNAVPSHCCALSLSTRTRCRVHAVVMPDRHAGKGSGRQASELGACGSLMLQGLLKSDA